MHKSFFVLESELKVNLFLMQHCRMLVEDIAGVNILPGFSATWR